MDAKIFSSKNISSSSERDSLTLAICRKYCTVTPVQSEWDFLRYIISRKYCTVTPVQSEWDFLGI